MSDNYSAEAAPLRWGGYSPNAIWTPTGAHVYVRELLGEGGVTQVVLEDGKEEWTNMRFLIFDPQSY